MRTPGYALVVAALWGACGSTSELPPSDPELKAPLLTVNETPVRNEAVDPASCKPQPPIAISLASRELTGGSYELTLSVTPTATVDSLDLAFVLPPGARIDRPERASFGATARGETRTMVATIATHERTSEISAIARVPVEGITMSKAATVTVGEPKAQPRTRRYATADGELAREVRP